MSIIESYKVYVKTDENSIITAINSTAFFEPTNEWILIDEGSGDEYHHAQGNYLPHSLTDINGIYNYKLVDGNIVERTDEEKQPERDKLNARAQIIAFKHMLKETDYVASKIAEGVATREEYADQLAERAEWRRRINELEASLT